MDNSKAPPWNVLEGTGSTVPSIHALWGSFIAPSTIPMAGDFSPAVVLGKGGGANQYQSMLESSSVSSRCLISTSAFCSLSLSLPAEQD